MSALVVSYNFIYVFIYLFIYFEYNYVMTELANWKHIPLPWLHVTEQFSSSITLLHDIFFVNN